MTTGHPRTEVVPGFCGLRPIVAQCPSTAVREALAGVAPGLYVLCVWRCRSKHCAALHFERRFQEIHASVASDAPVDRVGRQRANKKIMGSVVSCIGSLVGTVCGAVEECLRAVASCFMVRCAERITDTRS
jgi:hypothetical protein